MSAEYRWQTLEVNCPEEGCTATLLVQWDVSGAEPVLNGVHCDHPRLKDLDNWSCDWSCWQAVQEQRAHPVAVPA
jgi:hypothetical protein